MFGESLGSVGALGGSSFGVAGMMGLSAATTAYNIYQQERNYNYQKGLQQDIFRREDNAIQRRVADLKAAGLSPVLAAGNGAASGAVVSTTAPQADDLADKYRNLVTMSNDIATSKSQRDLIAEQTNNAREQNALIKSQKSAADASAVKSLADAALKTQDTKMYKVLGIPSTMSANSKDASIVIDLYKRLKAKALGMTDEEYLKYNLDGSLKEKPKKNYRPGSSSGGW